MLHLDEEIDWHQILGVKGLKSKLKQLVCLILIQRVAIRTLLSSYFRKIQPDKILMKQNPNG